MRFLIVLSMVISGQGALGQKKEFGLPPVDLRQGQVVQGDLFTVKVVPGDRRTSFFIVGKKAADLNLDTLQLQLTSLKTKTPVTLKREKDGFVYEERLLMDSDLQIRTPEGKTETIKLKARP